MDLRVNTITSRSSYTPCAAELGLRCRDGDDAEDDDADDDAIEIRPTSRAAQ